MRRAPDRWRAAAVAIGLVAIGIVPPAGLASDPGADGILADAGGRVALMVFVGCPAPGAPLEDPGSTRRMAAVELASALGQTGRDVVTYPVLESLLRERRIRTGRDVDFPLLAALAHEYDADTLVLARFSIGPDRVILLARAVSTEDGHLRWVDVAEAPRSGLPEDALRAASRDLVAGLAGPPADPARPGIVVMPLRPVGLGRDVADVATHCLLRSLLATGRWTLPDPSPVTFELLREGLDPTLLEDGSRLRLAERTGTELLLVPRLEAFPASLSFAPAINPFDEDGADVGGVPAGESPVHFSIVAVRTGSGHVTDGASVYLVPESRLGPFGTRRDVPVTRRFRTGAERLVEMLLPQEGGS